MEPRYLVLALIVVAAMALIVAGMAVSLRRRRARQSDLDTALAPVPLDLAPALLTDPVLHVATTRGGDPYERIAAGGLGFRARGTASVHPEGLLLDLDGGTRRFVPSAQLRGAGRATWTLDRVVERDGLVLVGWRLGAADVDTYLRAERPDDLVEALLRIVPASAPIPTGETP